MKEMNKKIIFLILIIFLTAFSSAKYYNNYSDVVILCNENSAISQEICNYFLQERTSLGFPEENIINLTEITTDETINYSQYYSIFNQTNISIKALESTGKIINYIITTKGIPLRTGYGYNCNAVPMPSECLSVDSRLMKDLGANNSYNSRDYNYIKDAFNHTLYGGYLITRLDGYDINDIKKLIDSSTQAQQSGLTGEILINCYVTNPHYYTYNTNCISANTTISSKGYQTNFTNSSFIKNMHNLGGYVSWGSNAQSIGCTTASCANSSSWNFSFNPGALGETFVSTSARTFNAYPWTSGQSLISDLIKYNITGIKGYVYEPGTNALANVDTLWERYLSGYNLADSYYMASSTRNWTDVVVGDPKTYVIPQSENNPTILESPLDGERITNGTIINFTINSTDFWEIDSVWYTIDEGTTNTTLESPYDILVDTFGSYGEYNLTIYINDTYGEESSKNYSFIFNTTNGTTPTYSKFNGSLTTDFKILENKEEIENPILEIEGIGKIEFYGTYNLSGLDLDANIDIENNLLHLDSEVLNELNTTANITFYNMPLKTNAQIYKDDILCEDCYNFTSLTSENVTFNVSSFSKYSIQDSEAENITSCQKISEPGRYFLTQNINSTGNCLNITANNVFIDGQNFQITNYTGKGITSNNNYTAIQNIAIAKTEEPATTDYGITLEYNKFNKLANITINNSYTGIWLSYSNNNEINNMMTNSNIYGTYLLSSANNTFQNLTSNSNEQKALLIISSNENQFQNITANNSYYIFSIENSNNNNFTNTNISEGNYGVYLTASTNNKFTNLSANNNEGKDIYLDSSDDNELIDSPNIKYYTKNTRKSRLKITNSSAGKIEFLDQIYTAVYYYVWPSEGKNTSLDFTIKNNYVYVNTTNNPYLDVSANITLYNIPTDITSPRVFRNGQVCTTCINYTPLNAGTIKFFVSGFSNYSIESYLGSGELLIGIASPSSSNYTNRTQSLIITTISGETIDKIWYNWNGTNLTYDGTTQIEFDEGENNLTAWANDTLGNINRTDTTFTIDSTAPNTEIVSPTNNTNYTTSSITLNITNSSDANHVWWLNESTEVTYNEPIVLNLSDGNHNITACSSDTFGNENCTTVFFLIDTTTESEDETSPIDSGNGGGGGGGGGGGTTQANMTTTKIIEEATNYLETNNVYQEEKEKEVEQKKDSLKIIIVVILCIVFILPIILIVKKISRH